MIAYIIKKQVLDQRNFKMSWDWIITATILVVLVLGFWAKISRQTIGELIRDIMDKIKGTTEDSIDYATEVVSYD